MRLRYFAWIRLRTGVGEETWTPHPPVDSLGALMARLRARGGGYARAFASPDGIRVAVNGACAGPDTVLRPEDEVIFFPPVTGG